jgi:hypothetical protein
VGPADPIPHAPTLADKLGPWPLSAVLMTLLGLAAMAMIWWPWEVLGRARGATGESRSGADGVGGLGGVVEGKVDGDAQAVGGGRD